MEQKLILCINTNFNLPLLCTSTNKAVCLRVWFSLYYFICFIFLFHLTDLFSCSASMFHISVPYFCSLFLVPIHVKKITFINLFYISTLYFFFIFLLHNPASYFLFFFRLLIPALQPRSTSVPYPFSICIIYFLIWAWYYSSHFYERIYFNSEAYISRTYWARIIKSLLGSLVLIEFINVFIGFEG